jgi:hypothetical protein
LGLVWPIQSSKIHRIYELRVTSSLQQEKHSSEDVRGCTRKHFILEKISEMNKKNVRKMSVPENISVAIAKVMQNKKYF